MEMDIDNERRCTLKNEWWCIRSIDVEKRIELLEKHVLSSKGNRRRASSSDVPVVTMLVPAFRESGFETPSLWFQIKEFRTGWAFSLWPDGERFPCLLFQ